MDLSFISTTGRYVTRGIVYDLLEDSARVAGLPYQSRKRHSFCIGAASVAAATSLPDWLIKVSQPLVLGLLPAVYQNSSIYIRVCGSQDGYCSWTLPANIASFFFFLLVDPFSRWAWGDALPRMHQWRLSLRSDFPQACWPRCRLISPANRYSCPIQHVLYCIQLVVLGR